MWTHDELRSTGTSRSSGRTIPSGLNAAERRPRARGPRRRFDLSWSNWGFGQEKLSTSVERLASPGLGYIELHGNHYGKDLGYRLSETETILNDHGVKAAGVCAMHSAESEPPRCRTGPARPPSTTRAAGWTSARRSGPALRGTSDFGVVDRCALWRPTVGWPTQRASPAEHDECHGEQVTAPPRGPSPPGATLDS